jgi:glycine/D-amino acid oxidase-like deaminating enzyme
VTSNLNDQGLVTAPYWWEAAPLPDLDQVPLPERVDVAIVGAGYAGLSAALTLARAGRQVAVFEAESPGIGASTRNGGIASGSIRLSHDALVRRLGADGAVAVHREGKVARRDLVDFLEREKIACDFALSGRFTGARIAKDYEVLAREAELLSRHGDIEVEVVPRAEQHREIGSDFYHGGLLRPDIGGLHPGQFHQGLLARAQEAGVTVLAWTPVTGIEREAEGFAVATGRGTVTARETIVATNGYSGAATGWLQRRIIPIQSQIIATAPLDRQVMDRLMPRARMIGDTCRLHHYYRPSPDGTRILFGGRAGASKADPRASGAHLHRDLLRVFPDLAGVAISHSWSGFTGFTFDELPHLAVHDGVHYATGFCGSGVVWAPYLGRKAALKILGDKAAETVFDRGSLPTRPLYGGQPWFLPAVYAYYGLRDRLPF